MDYSAKEMIKNRKSVRTFSGKPLSAADKAKVEEHMRAAGNPWNVPIAICHFDLVMSENGITGNFINSAPGIEVPKNTYYITTFEPVDHK